MPSLPLTRKTSTIQWDQQTLIVSSTILFLAIFSSAIAAVPRLRLVESKVCRSYYISQPNSSTASSGIADDAEILEMLCKTPHVQTELSTLLGWNSFIGSLPSLILATFYTILAETISRRTLLLINVLSSVLGMACLLMIVHLSTTLSSIRWMWVANAFDCIGGGSLVFNTVVQVLVANSVPGVKLSKVLFHLTAILTVSRMLGVSLGSFLMETTPWLPLIMALLLSMLRIGPILLLDDQPAAVSTTSASQHQYQHQGARGYRYRVLHNTDTSTSQARQSDSWRATSPNANNISPTIPSIPHPQNVTPTTSGPTASSLTHFNLRAILSSLPILYINTLQDLYNVSKSNLLVLVTFFIHELAMGVRTIAGQWTSTRYSVPLSDVGYILSLETLVSAIVLAVIPVIVSYFNTSTTRTPAGATKSEYRIGHILERVGTKATDRGASVTLSKQTSSEADVAVAQISLLFASLGAIAIGLSPSVSFLFPSLLLFALGVGFHDALKAYATNLIVDRSSSAGFDTKNGVDDEEYHADLTHGTIGAGDSMEMGIIADDDARGSDGIIREDGSKQEDEQQVVENNRNGPELSRFYMCLSVLEIVANMFSGPIWAQIYATAVGMKDLLAGLLIGMPFWISALGFWAAWVTLKLMHRRRELR